MKVDPAAKDLSFTSQASCPDVTVSGSQNADEFLIDIAYPNKYGINNPPASCVSVTVSVPPAYIFDPAFKLNANLMAVSATVDLGNLVIGSLTLTGMSGDLEVKNVKVTDQVTISNMSGGIKVSKVDGAFSNAKISSMSGQIDINEFSSSTANANFNINNMSGTINTNFVSFNFGDY
jgi:hypothetical protein